MLNKKALAATAGAQKLYVEDVFSTYLYTGNGTSQTITNGIDLSGEGGLVWIKQRSLSYTHALVDTVRGTDKVLCSNNTNAEQTGDPGFVTQFNSNGFAIGDQGRVNLSTYDFASWTFRKAEKFFDVVTYTGNGTAGRTVSHNLGSVPGCVIVKCTDTGSTSWAVYHRSLGATQAIYLNSSNAAFTSSNIWNDTAPTSTVFTVGFTGANNANGQTYVAYLFAHDAGGFGDSGSDNVISCGSFTTDGSGNATVSLGYEPQWALIKPSNSTGDWVLVDTMRGWVVAGNNDALLYANTSDAEVTGNNFGNPTATGFTVGGLTFSNTTYIYIAIRRGPMKTPEAGTEVFSVESYDQTSASDPAFNLGNVADMGFRRTTGEDSWRLQTRLTGDQGLITNLTNAESTMNYGKWDNNVGWYQGASITPPYSQANWYGWTFRRAPGFFDVVCWTADNTYSSINHNLGVTPEFVIQKRRDGTSNWFAYTASDLGYLELTDAFFSFSRTLTSTTFQPASTGPSYTYVTYLFATCPGVSKVGSYTGTGTTLQVNCGFTAGSRFVMIKRTDSTGDWYVWDSARGIVAGNDPYLLLNSTAAEVTNTDYIDTYSQGFEISSTAPAAINANGGTFIFLAIA